jgi:tetratricopeptide (TPR) repeat protein
VLETQDLDRAKALIPVEVKRAREAVKGAPADAAAKPRAKLRGQVYRPPIDGEQPAATTGSAGSTLSASIASPAPKKAVSDEDRAIERDVNEAFKALKGADHFKVMGLPREATSDELKKAYFELAKRYHPDRVAGHNFTNPEQVEPLYGTYLAWARYLDERKPKAEREAQAREALEALLKKGANAETAYYLGMVVKLSGNEKTALRYFKQATELNPNHNDAQREVRLAELRAEKSRQVDAAPRKDGGLLDRLLKK